MLLDFILQGQVRWKQIYIALSGIDSYFVDDIEFYLFSASFPSSKRGPSPPHHSAERSLAKRSPLVVPAA